MRKSLLTGVFAVSVVALLGAFATTATAFPSKTTSCASCHSGPVLVVTATQTSNNGTTAGYSVSAPGADYIAVFDSGAKISQISASSGSISVAVGKTYVLQAVEGPNEDTGWGSTSISPVAPVLDTIAPVTSSNAATGYAGPATIKLTATDNAGGSGVAHTYYVVDGGTQAEGATVLVSAVGTHTVDFWSADAAGNVETPATTVTFTVTAAVAKTNTIKCSDYTVKRNHRATLSGVITPAAVGTHTALYIKKPGSSRWVLLKRPTASKLSGTTGAKWSYAYLFKIRGTYRFQVRWSGVTSRTIKVVVRR